MAKTVRERTNDEMVIEWLSDDIGYEMRKLGLKLRKLKLTSSGSDWFMIITVYDDEGAKVAFVGARDLKSLARKLVKEIKDDTLVWKDDQYE